MVVDEWHSVHPMLVQDMFWDATTDVDTTTDTQKKTTLFQAETIDETE